MKTKVNYLPFLLGALVWIVSVALKFAWAIPINKKLLNLLLPVLGNSFGNCFKLHLPIALVLIKILAYNNYNMNLI